MVTTSSIRQVTIPAEKHIQRVEPPAPRRLGVVLPKDRGPIAGPSGDATLDRLYDPIAEYPRPINLSFAGETAAGAGVQVIFWGAAWNRPVTPSAAALDADVQSILFGPWRAGLKQYGIGQVPYRGAITVSQPVPPATYDDADIDSLMLTLINGAVIPPSRVDLYIVFMPPGTRCTKIINGKSLRGMHWALTYPSFPLGTSTARVACVTSQTEGQMTATFCHELAEMLTDPIPGNGYFINGDPSLEIGDVCNGIDVSLRGVEVEAYWSQKDNACLVPGVPSLRTTLTRAGIKLNGAGLRSVPNAAPSVEGFLTDLYKTTV